MKLFYRKYGDGQPLIILHGLYGSSDNWISIAKAVSDRFSVFLPDLRNHGLSPHSEIHDYESLSSDLFEFVNELGLDKFFLAGHSMGGKTAVFFALKWPEKLNGLVVADISPFKAIDPGASDYLNHLAILSVISQTDLSAISSRSDIEKALAVKISSPGIMGLIMKNIRRGEDNKFKWKINAHALLNNLENIMNGLPRPSGNYQPVTGFPVRILKGERSGYLSERDWTDILKIFPAAELITIKNAGHWLHSDNADEVITSLLSLLDN